MTSGTGNRYNIEIFLYSWRALWNPTEQLLLIELYNGHGTAAAPRLKSTAIVQLRPISCFDTPFMAFQSGAGSLVPATACRRQLVQTRCQPAGFIGAPPGPSVVGSSHAMPTLRTPSRCYGVDIKQHGRGDDCCSSRQVPPAPCCWGGNAVARQRLCIELLTVVLVTVVGERQSSTHKTKSYCRPIIAHRATVNDQRAL